MFLKFRLITRLQFTGTSVAISAHLDDHKAIKMHTKQSFKEHLLHYQLFKPY